MCHVMPLVSCEQRGVLSRSGAVNTCWSRARLEPGRETIVTATVRGHGVGTNSRKHAEKEECGHFRENLLDRIPTLCDEAEAVNNESFCHTHRKPATHAHTQLIKTSFQSWNEKVCIYGTLNCCCKPATHAHDHMSLPWPSLVWAVPTMTILVKLWASLKGFANLYGKIASPQFPYYFT